MTGREGRAPAVAIVGGGISGLVLAHELLKISPAAEIVVMEADDRPGGKIDTREIDGLRLEWGPNGFLDNKPATIALAQELGLRQRLLPSDGAARKRYVFSRGKLHRLPESPGAFLKSGLLSWPAKLRVLMEPLARRRPEDRDETVEEFARRRLGRQAAARLIDPMVSGVFAGDPRALSLAAAFPRIAELERQYGGLFKALRRISRERRREGGAAVSPQPGGRLTSFEDGLGELPLSLARALGDRLRLGCRVTGLECGGAAGGASNPRAFRLRCAEGPPVDADLVALAIPAHESARLLATSQNGSCPAEARAAAEVAALLEEIPYSPLAVVSLCYDRDSLGHDLDGFGFLIPREEQRDLLGALWTSSIFPGRRAPRDTALLTCMVGGARLGHLLERDDESLVALTREEIRHAMGINAVPKRAVVFRHQQAIPSYPPGHPARVARMEQTLAKRLPGLVLVGNAYKGIGVNDCIINSTAAAAGLLRRSGT